MASIASPAEAFLPAYAKFLIDCAENEHRDNYDWRRFGPETAPTTAPSRRAELFHALRRKAGYLDRGCTEEALTAGLRFVEPHADQLQWLYSRLGEPKSRELLVQLIAYRALGRRRVKLPTNAPEYWSPIEALERQSEGREFLDANFLGWRLPRLSMHDFGFPLELFITPMGAALQFAHQQYRCDAATECVEARAGDVVVDAGGCWGDSGLYFASRVGETGRVYSYEFLADNLAPFRRNLALNPDLAGRLELIEAPLWSTPDVELFVHGNGPGTTVEPTRRAAEDAAIRTTTIDALLDRPEVSRIDFIKMDIEGAELHALQGAVETLRRFRPRLAITVYHRLEDAWEIPQYLESLELEYRFYLRHFTIYTEETVLFAISEPPSGRPRGAE